MSIKEHSFKRISIIFYKKYVANGNNRKVKFLIAIDQFNVRGYIKYSINSLLIRGLIIQMYLKTKPFLITNRSKQLANSF